ncbi:hypothetical protein PHJA_002009100 [Phtheirospermum japonicum]|uniref:Uncharacterized protein n=1 Tax=Phtheirospermum japonicum TaxID=374723 RepID=A0A830CK86_9LAMI|nr:hypothetical protein PHJA_002009100 [Phtheirospermum japonicum]
MASSKVMASWSPTNPDLPRQPSPPRSNLQTEPSRGLGSMNFDDILRNICSDSQPFALEGGGGGVGDGTAEEVWRDIVNGGAGEGGSEGPAMTLEDFLAKAGAVDEEDPAGGFVMEAAAMSPATGVPAVSICPGVRARWDGGSKRRQWKREEEGGCGACARQGHAAKAEKND